jgi:hypothetical protein
VRHCDAAGIQESIHAVLHAAVLRAVQLSRLDGVRDALLPAHVRQGVNSCFTPLASGLGSDGRPPDTCGNVGNVPPGPKGEVCREVGELSWEREVLKGTEGQEARKLTGLHARLLVLVGQELAELALVLVVEPLEVVVVEGCAVHCAGISRGEKGG